MTNDDINRAVAIASGHITPPEGMGNFTYGLKDKFMTSGEWFRIHIPDYCKDLNAIQPVVLALPNSLKEAYIDWLSDLSVNLCSSKKEAEFDLANASARQKSEAYLRAIGKWEG